MCAHLDRLLDKVGAADRHRAAEKLLELHMETLLTHGPDTAAGLARAIPIVDRCEGCAVVRRQRTEETVMEDRP
jgi:hypothetical protein